MGRRENIRKVNREKEGKGERYGREGEEEKEG